MNLTDLIRGGIAGFGFVLLFFTLMLVFAAADRNQPRRFLREIPAFARLGRSVGLAVEAGQRLHLTLGRGVIFGLQGAAAFIGLMILRRIARTASISDRPPVATSGEGTLALLSQDSLRSAYLAMGAGIPFDPNSAQLSGATPFSYAVGTLPVIYDQQVSVNILAGHFGAEVALITDAGERTGGLTLAGSDSVPAQAVLYATSQEPLIGEELYAAGAYLQAGPMHIASVRTQDFFRWVIVAAILGGALLKLAGVL